MSNFRQRDTLASQHLGMHLGHTAAGLVRTEIRKVFQGYLYWNHRSLLFIADDPIFTNGNLLKLDFDEIGIPKSKYLLWNGELDFGNGMWIFHGQKKHIKDMESVVNRSR